MASRAEKCARSSATACPMAASCSRLSSGSTAKSPRFAPGASQPEFLALQLPHVSAVGDKCTAHGWLFLGSGGGKPPQLYYTTRPEIRAHSGEDAATYTGAHAERGSQAAAMEERALALYLPPQAAKQHVPASWRCSGGPLGRIPMPMSHRSISCWVTAGPFCGPIRVAPAAMARPSRPRTRYLGGGDYRDIYGWRRCRAKHRAHRQQPH